MLCGQRLGLADFWPHSMPRNPQNSNPILCECDSARVAHSRARPPGFSRSSVQWSYVVRPRQLFQAGIAILARKVTMDDMPSWNFSTAAGAIDMLRPALRGAFSGTGVDFSVPLVFHVTQRPDVRVQHVDRGRTHSNSPAPEPNATPWENGRVTPSVSRDAVPASPTGPLLVLAPPVNDRQGRC